MDGQAGDDNETSRCGQAEAEEDNAEHGGIGLLTDGAGQDKVRGRERARCRASFSVYSMRPIWQKTTIKNYSVFSLFLTYFLPVGPPNPLGRAAQPLWYIINNVKKVCPRSRKRGETAPGPLRTHKKFLQEWPGFAKIDD
ncbi:MAG: hypothetical protein LUG58_00005 [Clostridiales bacterium]|nr:hypothetical protein [Clostridiales bacterium]